MYRSRSKIDLDEDAFSFLSSFEDDDTILHYDILGSEAHCVMLHEIGFLNLIDLKKILQALEQAKMNPKMLYANVREDIHESLEAFVIEQIGIESGGKMHTARSRNDQVILDVHMKIRENINNISESIIDLIDNLLGKAGENKETVMPMYTHTQQAQIGNFSHFLLAYVDALFRDIDRLYISYRRINQSALGACAIGGSSINIDRRKTAMLLGFDGPIKNSIDATSSRDSLIEFASSVSILMSTLSRMAEDFILWSTFEFGYIDISDKYSSTSSAMPQKKNPDVLEIIRAKSGLVIGSLVTMLSLVKSLPSGYSRDLQEFKPLLWRISTVAVESVKIMTGVIKSLSVRKERMREAASNSYAISFDIAEQLTVKKGISFRSAHKIVGALVEEAVSKQNIPFTMLQEEDIENALNRVGSSIKPKDLQRLIREITPFRSLELRSSSGSPNPREQCCMISSSYSNLASYRKGVSRRKENITTAFDNLSKIVNGYLQS